MIIDDYPVEQKTAFVLGAEKSGLLDTTMDNADVFVKIPMYGFTESYNVSVTAAMVLHSVIQRMHNSDLDWRLSKEEQWFTKLSWTLKSIQSSAAIVRRFMEENPDKTSLFPFEKFNKE